MKRRKRLSALSSEPLNIKSHEDEMKALCKKHQIENLIIKIDVDEFSMKLKKIPLKRVTDDKVLELFKSILNILQ